MKIFEDNVLKSCGGIPPPPLGSPQRKDNILQLLCEIFIFVHKFGIIGKPVKNLTNLYMIVKNFCKMQLGEIYKQMWWIPPPPTRVE